MKTSDVQSCSICWCPEGNDIPKGEPGFHQKAFVIPISIIAVVNHYSPAVGRDDHAPWLFWVQAPTFKCHQPRMDATANAPVSWSVPTFTKPFVTTQVANTVWIRARHLQGSGNRARSQGWVFYGTPLLTAVFVVADEFLFLGVH